MASIRELLEAVHRGQQTTQAEIREMRENLVILRIDVAKHIQAFDDHLVDHARDNERRKPWWNAVVSAIVASITSGVMFVIGWLWRRGV